MKCLDAEKSILLQDSGELGRARTRDLEAHLDGCAACSRFRQLLLESADALHPDHEPSARAVQDVLRTARLTAPARGQQPVWGWKPAMAVAAAVMAIGLFFGIYSPDRVGIEFDIADAQLLEPEDQVVSIMYDGLSEEDLAFNFLMTFEEEVEG